MTIENIFIDFNTLKLLNMPSTEIANRILASGVYYGKLKINNLELDLEFHQKHKYFGHIVRFGSHIDCEKNIFNNSLCVSSQVGMDMFEDGFCVSYLIYSTLETIYSSDGAPLNTMDESIGELTRML